MTIGPIGSGLNIVPLQPAQSASQTTAAPGFGARVEDAVKEVNMAQSKAAQSAQAWEKGIEQDLSAVMVDQQVASLGFQLTLDVRNKALGAYRDIMNMPV